MEYPNTEEGWEKLFIEKTREYGNKLDKALEESPAAFKKSAHAFGENCSDILWFMVAPRPYIFGYIRRKLEKIFGRNTEAQKELDRLYDLTFEQIRVISQLLIELEKEGKLSKEQK